MRQADTFKVFLRRAKTEWDRQRLAEDIDANVTNGIFARYLDIPETTFSDLWRGVRVPSQEILQRIASRLGVVETYTAAGMPVPMPDDLNLKAIVRVWDQLTETEQEEVAHLARQRAANQAVTTGG